MVRQKQRYLVTLSDKGLGEEEAILRAVNLHFAKAEAHKVWGSRVVSVKAC